MTQQSTILQPMLIIIIIFNLYNHKNCAQISVILLGYNSKKLDYSFQDFISPSKLFSRQNAYIFITRRPIRSSDQMARIPVKHEDIPRNLFLIY